MLHFFPHYAQDVENHPFATELRRMKVPYRMFGRVINLRYRYVFSLLFRVYPCLVYFALISAVRSLILSRPRPTSAIINTDVEAVIFGSIRRLFRIPVTIVLESLIITPRRSNLSKKIFHLYFSFILYLVDIAICHSRIERDRYQRKFPKSRCRFIFIPYGTTVSDRQKLIAAFAALGEKIAVIVSAGRSGRDYRTLADAIRGLPCKLHIICDLPAPVALLEKTSQIDIITDCFEWDYIEAIANALFIVIPLAADEISAGQMVLLQSSALGKAVVITRTATTIDYATDGQDALFVDLGDVQQLRQAILRLLDDPNYRKNIGANAAARFERDHSTEAYVQKIVAALTIPRRDADQR